MCAQILQRLCRHCTKIVLNLSNVRRVRRDAPAAAFVKHWTGVLGTGSGAGYKSKQFTSDYRAGCVAQYTAGNLAQLRLDFQYKFNWKSSRNTNENLLTSIGNPVDPKLIVWEFGERVG